VRPGGRLREGIAGGAHARRRVRALSLVELLVVVAIIAVLLAILVGTLSRVRGAAHSFMCKNKLKTVAFEFFQFADPVGYVNRGDSDALDLRGFKIEDFQERVYRISEFWDAGAQTQVDYKSDEQPLLCAAGPQKLTRRKGLPCQNNAVSPPENVSVGFNMRLDKMSQQVGGVWVLKNVRLTKRILEHPSVPLAFDVDGRSAAESGRLPHYSAPPAGDPGIYGNGQFWFPSSRHGGQTNACFVGGHVLSSRNPETDAGWDWKYQHPVN